MKDEDKLPRALVWRDEGAGAHLSEVALTAIADGQTAIVPDDALAHARTCGACTQAVGDLAMLSARVTEALESAVRTEAPMTALAPATAPAPRLPWVAIAAALVVAAVGALPALADWRTGIGEASGFFTHTVPLLVRSGLAIVRSGGGSLGPAVSFACAGLLMTAGFAVSRAMPRRSVS